MVINYLIILFNLFIKANFIIILYQYWNYYFITFTFLNIANFSYIYYYL